MNWKQEFYKKFSYIQAVKNEESGNSYNPIVDYISTEIIEKLGQEFGNIIMEEHYSVRKERLITLMLKWLN